MTLAHDLKACYRELGLPLGSCLADVKKAYHALAKELHPDLNPGARGIMMSRVNKAYRVLKKHLEQQQAYKAYVFQTFVSNPYSNQSLKKKNEPKKATKNKSLKSACSMGPLDVALKSSVSLGPLGSLRHEQEKKPNRFWRLLGLDITDGQLIYKTEIEGKVDCLSLPVRRLRNCEFCRGKGFEESLLGVFSCSHCGGKGRITCSETLKVSVPHNWQSGQRIQTKAEHQGMPIVVELLAFGVKEK